jgi:hypothetical protein
MPAEAGIQTAVNLNHFKALDSRFRGNDGGFPIATQSQKGTRGDFPVRECLVPKQGLRILIGFSKRVGHNFEI